MKSGRFPTDDVAKFDADGYMLIADCSNDVIKSGGKWIGSTGRENIAMARPAVAMAACIAAGAHQVRRAAAAGGNGQAPKSPARH